jgi:hypothetical protein
MNAIKAPITAKCHISVFGQCAAVLDQYATQYVTNIGACFLFYIGQILIAILAEF